MPILAVNEYGQIYQTSSDRSDGLGFGNAPECAQQGDVTLGAAFLKSAAARTASLLMSHRNQQIQDMKDNIRAKVEKNNRAMSARQEAYEASLHDNPQYREAMMRRAVMEGCSCEYATKLNGNVMTANGQSGIAGMGQEARVVHEVASGRGAISAHPADPEELHQAKMRQEAMRHIRVMAKR